LNYKSFAIRTLVAVIFGPLVILTALWGSWYWFGFILLVALLSVYEFFDLAEKKAARGQLEWGLATTVALMVSFFFFYEIYFFSIMLISVIVMFFIEMYRRNGSPTLNLPVTFFGVMFYSAGLGSFILIRELPRRYGLDYAPAGKWLVLLIVAIWVCDTAAYIFGSYFGKHKLIERISPKKSIEGTVAGFIFAVISAYICHITFINELRLQDSLVIGAIAGSIGQYGDLFESMLKRDAGVKDSSHLIPEHGGILDRFDSLTISAPVVYLYLTHLAF
jgi:phosphatidate cytidylyltransferase